MWGGCDHDVSLHREPRIRYSVCWLRCTGHAGIQKFQILYTISDKTKYMIMSRDQNAGRSHSMNIDNSSIERVEEFKYLGTTLTNKNSIQEEIKSRLKVGNACYYSVQNLSTSSLLSKKLKIKIYRTIILPLFCMGVKLGR